MVWHMSYNCSGCGYGYDQWRFPVTVKWMSVYRPEDLLADPELLMTACYEERDWEEYLQGQINALGPMVAITEIDWPEKSMQDSCIHESETTSENLIVSTEDCRGNDCLMGNPIIGLVPVLNVVPITEAHYEVFTQQLSEARVKHGDIFENVWAFCGCDTSHEEERCPFYPTPSWAYASRSDEPPAERDRRDRYWADVAHCNCETHGYMRYVEETVNEAPTYVEETGNPVLIGAWAYLLDRYVAGWRHANEIYAAAGIRRESMGSYGSLISYTPPGTSGVDLIENLRKQKEYAWLTSYSSSFSPFWQSSSFTDWATTHAPGLLAA